VHFWNLGGEDKSVHTLLMQIPRCSSESFSLRISAAFLLIFAATLPLPALGYRQLQCSPSNLNFGTVSIGQLETQAVTITNTGQTSATITAISVTNSEFLVSGIDLPLALAAGQSVSVSIIFAPTATGNTHGRVIFSSNASNPNLQLYVLGSGATAEVLTASPSSLSFGQVAVGTSATLPVALTNPGASAETLTALQLSGTGFSVSGPTFPLALSPGQSLTLDVTFSPQTSSVASGSILISGPNLNVPLTGTGVTVGQLTLSPTALSFGNVNVGTSMTQPLSLSATGGTVIVSSASSSNSQFSISGASFPLTIAAGQNTTIDAVFSPSQSGASSGTVTFASTASNSQISESLTGTGVTPQYTVSLSWSASTSSGVTGYNVYRGTAVGSYSKINATLDSTTTYSDSTAVSGVTYYYAATAVNSSGQESAYSSPVQVAVP